MGQVVIIAYTPQPEKICAAAASISTTKGTALEIYRKKKADAQARNLIKNVLKLGHTTTIEHACFTLAFENVSAFVEQFMIEFRLASFTVKSRRYVDFREMGYFQPEFRFTGKQKEKEYFHNLYQTLMARLFSEYEYFLEEGLSREDARFILPYSYHSNFYCTVNARELQHIIQVALGGRGQDYPEIKQVGESLWQQAQEIAPGIFHELPGEIKDNKEARLRELVGSQPDFRKEDFGGKTGASCELLAYPANIEEIVALAVLSKHTLWPTKEIKKRLRENEDWLTSLLEIACTDARQRELEQICFTWRLNNLSLAGLTHLTRHRLQSLNVPSFTEMKFSQAYLLPPAIQERPLLLARYQELWLEQQRVFREFSEAGIRAEDLVYLYLSGNLVDLLTTMNGRELFHFIKLRTCQRAQWEIRLVAEEMLWKLREIAPTLFQYFGPSCYVEGKCPEGKLSCGELKKVSEKFSWGGANEADSTIN